MIRILKVYTLVLAVSFASCKNKTSSKKIELLDTVSFEELSKISCEYLKNQQAHCMEKYKIGKYERWDYDQRTGKLIFSDQGVRKVIIDYEEVGSVSLKSNTWLWAWGNSSIEENVKKEITTIRTYGIKRGFESLLKAKWSADIVDGWDMAAISAYILKAKGVYRTPSHDNKLFSFMLFKKITVVDSLPKKK
ncbi:DUF6882 domain-containing protein [Pedobacter sp. 22163]|uniref:DUF6882 domain-containing protein n=1 Tax=Pedobacter sp. 22163 TaxID=3453883 RepID=UPI003F87359D